MEFWKEIEGLNGYEVSTEGRVRNMRRGRILSVEWRDNHRGRKDARVSIHGRHYLVSRLVAKTFLPVPEGKENLTVNHIDGDLRNNHVSNLEWMTRKENVMMAKNSGSFCAIDGPITLTDCATGEEISFDNVRKIGQFTKCSHGAIRRACYNRGAIRDMDGKVYSVRGKCSENPVVRRIPINGLQIEMHFE